MDKPKRIQRKRTKGWRMPENTIYVGRPTIYGNPFIIGQKYKSNDDFGIIGWGKALQYMTGDLIKITNREEAVEAFKKWTQRNPFSDEDIQKLKGKNLACFCPINQPCHADVLLEIVN